MRKIKEREMRDTQRERDERHTKRRNIQGGEAS